VRSILYRFPDIRELRKLVSQSNALELGLPEGERVDDGEWVLAIFELGDARRATSAAACGAHAPAEVRIVFEPRDWQRLADFVESEIEREENHDDDSVAVTVRRPRTAAAALHVQSSAASPRVLVVDDDADIRAVVSAILGAIDLVVTPAGSAEEALARMSDEHFDLVVLDWNLPKMNGLDLCRTLRMSSTLSCTPVLFLTANACSSDMVDAFASGADDYVVKPFRAPELSARIFSLLRRMASH
jgi:two-component system phosphate regulon response regulator PhoB